MGDKVTKIKRVPGAVKKGAEVTRDQPEHKPVSAVVASTGIIGSSTLSLYIIDKMPSNIDTKFGLAAFLAGLGAYSIHRYRDSELGLISRWATRVSMVGGLVVSGAGATNLVGTNSVEAGTKIVNPANTKTVPVSTPSSRTVTLTRENGKCAITAPMPNKAQYTALPQSGETGSKDAVDRDVTSLKNSLHTAGVLVGPVNASVDTSLSQSVDKLETDLLHISAASKWGQDDCFRADQMHIKGFEGIWIPR